MFILNLQECKKNKYKQNIEYYGLYKVFDFRQNKKYVLLKKT